MIAVKETAVREVMTSGVMAVRADADFKAMVTVMRSQRISAFPVIDTEGRVIGVVSEADLLLKEAASVPGEGAVWLPRLLDRSKAAGICAAEVMTKPAITIREDASVGVAARLMRSRKLKRLPVVDGDGQLRGIVTRTDLLAVFERPDDEIRAEIADDVISAEFELDPELVVVIVRFGVVTVTGSVPSGAVAFRILDAIKHLEGVVGVRNRLSYPENKNLLTPAEVP